MRSIMLATIATAFFALCPPPSSAILPLPAVSLDPPCTGIPDDQVHKIDFSAYFDTETQAQAVASRIDEKRFELVVRTAADGPDWILRAIYRTLPDADTYAKDTASLTALAKSDGGKNAGFGCVSKPHPR